MRVEEMSGEEGGGCKNHYWMNICSFTKQVIKPDIFKLVIKEKYASFMSHRLFAFKDYTKAKVTYSGRNWIKWE